MLADPAKGESLPVVMPFRRVNAQYVSTGFEQCRDPLLIVAGVDSRTNNIAFVIVQQFIGVLLMALIVLAEDKTTQTAVMMGREFSLLSQMMSLASERVVPSLAQISFSKGVMNAETGVSRSIRLTR